MIKKAQDQPSVFFATCARLLPRDVELTIRQNYSGGLDETDLQILRAIRDSIPTVNEMQPQVVLEYTLDAIRAHSAKLIAPEAITEGQSRQTTDSD